MRTKIFAVIITGISLCAALSAQEMFKTPDCGFVSRMSAVDWQSSLLTGNGTMGAMVPGNAYDERLYLSHAALYLPYKTSGAEYLQGKRLDEIRQLCLAGKYREAGEIIDDIKQKAGFTDERDPFIGGLCVHIRQETGATTHYQRSVNYATGEAVTEWQNEHGAFQRTVFASRPDSIVVIRLTGTKPINAVVAFEELPVSDSYDQIKKDKFVKDIDANLKQKYLSFRTLFKYTNPYNTLSGYEAAGRLINKGGRLIYAGNEVIAEGVNELLLLVRIVPLPEKTESLFDALTSYLDGCKADYAQLLSPHAAVHGDLYGRVHLDLNAPAADRALATEQLIELSQTENPPLAMIEKAFNAGRYNIISCMGYNPPNLQGLWSGTWSAPWSGSFTTNGNLPTALAFVIPGNTPSLMYAYFDHCARLMDGYRTSARELYNTRGFHIPAQMTTNWRVMDNSPAYPHAYWTAGTAWAARWFFDYYQYTGDLAFLRDKAYPLMKDGAALYEDFLTVERNGKYVFVPSFSPENSPANTNVPTSINATMEVAACRQLLRNCITAATTLGIDKDRVALWKTMLTKLPDYEISPEGALREWLWPGLTDNYMHRHASHLYGLYDELPPEFKNNPKLLKAAEKAIDYRIKFFREIDPRMAFGICNAGWAAAHIGNTRQTTVITDWMARMYWTTGMGSLHNDHDLFNTDISGGYPYLISQCLAYSEIADDGQTVSLKLLPALPERWKIGHIDGLLLRGGTILKRLEWNDSAVSATLTAPNSGKIKVEYKGKIKTLKLVKDKPVTVKF